MLADRAQPLLDSIEKACDTPHAEFEPNESFLRNYLPFEGFARVLEPGVYMVVGDRGAGKSALFRASASPSVVQGLARELPSQRLPSPDEIEWVTGFSTGEKQCPTVDQLRSFAAASASEDRCRMFWFGLLIKRLQDENLLAPAGTRGGPIPPGDAGAPPPAGLAEFVADRIDELVGLLDRTDSDLGRKGRWAYLSYDDLDKLSVSDREAAATLLRGLMQFWSAHVRRWPRIVPKIFLRRDLYDRYALVGVDASKLAGRRVELRWSPRDLYAMLLKRLVNQSEELRVFLSDVLPEGREVEGLGWVPTARDEGSFEPPITRLCGQYMGAGPTKGQVFTWIPNHIEDAHGRIVPRSVIHLFQAAASFERRRTAGRGDPLLHHTSLRSAVDAVSERRIVELAEEYPWILPVANHLKDLSARLQVPVEPPRLHRELARTAWPLGAEPPERTGAGLFAALEELGIFYRRHDGRADVRDLYLSGFGLKRKGGVARSRIRR